MGPDDVGGSFDYMTVAKSIQGASRQINTGDHQSKVGSRLLRWKNDLAKHQMRCLMG